MTLAVCALALPAFACGSENASEDALDVRAAIPALDPAYQDFVGGEGVVPATSERMFCTHLAWDGDDMAFVDIQTVQGKFGHHAVLLGAKEPLPAGTVADCTQASEMAKYEAFTIAAGELPAGMGAFLPKGKKLVLQSHYVNTGLKPLLIRDVVRMKKIAIERVTTWASVYVTNTFDIGVPPHEEKTVEFDCTIQQPVDLVVLGGHMHQNGARFELLHGPDTAHLASIYLVDPWNAEFRDTPPVTLRFDDPLHLATGDVMHTSCTWQNDTDGVLGFPEEMCASFGYVAGSKEPIVCNVDKLQP